MTDTERERINAICEVAGVADIDDLSDGFHTFRQLYYQRMMLFAVIVKQNKDRAWKSFRHEDGEYCFGGGWFIVGIDTPEGSYTYHYENEYEYWDMFDCVDLPRAKHWDGHTEKDVTRLLSLPSTQPDLIAKIQNGIKATNTDDIYFCGMRNGMRWCISLIDDKEPLYENCPAAQPETCEGCKHLGKWENEVECGVPSPCTYCKRRDDDYYER